MLLELPKVVATQQR